MPRINIINETEANDQLKLLYDDISKTRGGVAEVLKIHSLLPETLKDHYNLYTTLMFKSRFTGISRKLLEMIAVTVSSTNNCQYCIEHHSIPLMSILKDEILLKAIQKRDWNFLVRKLDDKVLKVLLLADKITSLPSEIYEYEINDLKLVGFNEQQILHIVLVINYFNFVNRNVLTLGVELEPNFAITTN